MTKTQKGIRFRYGFRHDPMKWARTDDSLQAAMVRTQLLREPRPGDEVIIGAAVDEILATQKPDGHLRDKRMDDAMPSTGLALGRLLDLGVSPERPEVQKAAAAIQEAIDGGDHIWSYALKPMARLGKIKQPRVEMWISEKTREALNGLESAFGPGLPRTPDNEMQLLWYARNELDTLGDLETMLSWVEANVTPSATGIGLCPMWNLFSDITAVIEHPLAASIAAKVVPTILRTQHTDGSWGDRSFVVFATLVKHGLLERLVELPALPPDWHVARSIPAPGGRPDRLGWDGERLWVHDAEAGAVVAVSPVDGAVVKTVPVTAGSDVAGISLWRESLVLLATKPEEAIYVVDREAGTIAKKLPLPALKKERIGAIAEVDGQLVISDYWNGHFHRIDPDAPDRENRIRTASGMPFFAAGHGKAMWVVDALSPALIKTDLDGAFLDWGEKPFGNQDIAWDGKNLWALDSKNKRICIIEKAKSGKRLFKAPWPQP